MGNVIAYLRVSTEDQNLESQRKLIERNAEFKQLTITEWIELEISSQKEARQRRIHELKNKLQEGDVLITSELSRLGRSMLEVVQLVSDLVSKGVRVIVIHQNIDNVDSKNLAPTQRLILGIFSSLAEMERELISQRTKEGLLVARAEGKIGGRRAGTNYPSKYDKFLPQIKRWLNEKLSLITMTKLMKTGTPDSLSNYLVKKGIWTKLAKGPLKYRTGNDESC